MKHVVLLTAFFTPFRSGAEAMAEEVTDQLQSQFKFTIITARLTYKLPKQEQLRSGVTVHRVGFGLWIDKWLYAWLAAKKALQLQPDIVHANLESFAGLAMKKVKQRNPAIRTVLTNQNDDTKFKGTFETLKFIKTLHSYADAVTALSTALCNRSKKMGRSDVHLIPNGVHVQKIPMRKPVFGRILYVGRLEQIKGVDVLLKAFAQLPSHAHLRIVGSGSQAHTLTLQASMLKIADRVTFVGQLSHEQVLYEFAEAEIFCGLSRKEALGNVFIEALAARCAVVATNIGGIPDVITHNKNGLLVEADNVDQAVLALKTVLDDEALREQFIEEGLRTIHKFDWSTIAQQYAEVYKSLL